MPFDWTPEREETLRTMILSGMTGTEIACALGGGVTRNAVVGKGHRMGLRFKSRPARPKPMARTEPMAASTTRRPPKGRRKGLCLSALNPNCNTGEPKPPQRLAEKDTRAPDSPTPLTFDQMIDHRGCKWEVTGAMESDAFGFCGMPRAPGKPYCEHHAAMGKREPTKAEAKL